MSPPNKQAGELASKTDFISRRLRIRYRFLDLLQAPFGFVFWLIEQRKAWLQDVLANEGSEQ